MTKIIFIQTLLVYGDESTQLPSDHVTFYSTQMAFILGVGSYSSDTRGPFLMKLWGCIELLTTKNVYVKLFNGFTASKEKNADFWALGGTVSGLENFFAYQNIWWQTCDS